MFAPKRFPYPGTPTIRRIVVFRLADSRVEASTKEGDGVRGVLNKESEFVFQPQGAQDCPWFVLRGVYRPPLQSSREYAHGFSERTLIILPTQKWSGFQTLCRWVLLKHLWQGRRRLPLLRLLLSLTLALHLLGWESSFKHHRAEHKCRRHSP